MAENLLNPSCPGGTTEKSEVEEEGQSAVEHEASEPCFWVSTLMGSLIVVKGRRWPLGPNLCGSCIVVMPRFPPCMPCSLPFASKALFASPVLRNLF